MEKLAEKMTLSSDFLFLHITYAKLMVVLNEPTRCGIQSHAYCVR